jgi:SAM-dependent methyltransferase
MNQSRSDTCNAKGSPDRFGYAWNKYSKILPVYEELFQSWSLLIPKNEWYNKSFLDVGCGMGRNSYWPMIYGAKRGIGIDIDDRSLTAAASNLIDFPNYQTQNCSVYNISYSDVFDIVFSIGVIHHLKHPKLALEKMIQATKPGGKVMIWVYGKQNMKWIRLFNPLRKHIFAQLPIAITHFLSLFPTILLWISLKLGFGKIKYFHLDIYVQLFLIKCSQKSLITGKKKMF